MNATPYSESWNFGIQRELPESMLLNVEYIGQESTHQYFGIGGNYNIDHLGAQEEHMSVGAAPGAERSSRQSLLRDHTQQHADYKTIPACTFPILNSMA